jgi:hypothetical protein
MRDRLGADLLMTYTKTAWQDRIVQHPLTYSMVDNGDGTYTLTPVPGTVTQAGTPISAANLNKIEQGIADATATAEAALPKSGGTMTGDQSFSQNNANVKGAGQFLFASGKQRVWILSNAYFDGTNYMRYDTAQPAAAISPDASTGKAKFWYAAAGANPITWTETDIITNAGGQTIGGILYVGAGTDNSTPYGIGNFGYGGLSVEAVFANKNYASAAAALGFWDGATFMPGIMAKQDGSALIGSGYIRWNSSLGIFEQSADESTWKGIGGVKSIQRGTVTLNGSTQNVTISAINTAKSFISVNGAASIFTSGAVSTWYATLTSSTNLQIVSSGAGVANSPIAWEVIESY